MDLLNDYSPHNDSNFHGVPLVDAPVLFFVCFHEALRGELNHLRAETTSSSLLEDNNHAYDDKYELLIELQRRFEFLKLVLKYHCVAEDEVSEFMIIYTFILNY